MNKANVIIAAICFIVGIGISFLWNGFPFSAQNADQTAAPVDVANPAQDAAANPAPDAAADAEQGSVQNKVAEEIADKPKDDLEVEEPLPDGESEDVNTGRVRGKMGGRPDDTTIPLPF